MVAKLTKLRNSPSARGISAWVQVERSLFTFCCGPDPIGVHFMVILNVQGDNNDHSLPLSYRRGWHFAVIGGWNSDPRYCVNGSVNGSR